MSCVMSQEQVGFVTGHQGAITDVTQLALKTVAQTIPDKIVPKACAKLGPKLLKQLQNVRASKTFFLHNLSFR